MRAALMPGHGPHPGIRLREDDRADGCPDESESQTRLIPASRRAGIVASKEQATSKEALMSMGKVAVVVLAVALGGLGIGAAFADSRQVGEGSSLALVDEVRKNEVDDEVVAVQDDDGDGDDTNGNDG